MVCITYLNKAANCPAVQPDCCDYLSAQNIKYWALGFKKQRKQGVIPTTLVQKNCNSYRTDY